MVEMKVAFRYILIAVMSLVSMNVYGSNNDTVEDTIDDRKLKSLYEKVRYFKGISKDSAAVDSFRREYENDYWKVAALNGKLDLNDETVKYPKFVKWCIGVYNWADKTFNTYDTAYVVSTGKNWKLQVKNDNWFDTYYLRQPGGLRIGMSTDVAPNVGASISFLGVSLGYSLNVDKYFSDEPVKQKRFDFNFTCALLAVDAFYSKNNGTTNINKLNDYKNYNIFKPDYNFTGLTIETYGLDAYYFLNNKKYSQSAAYGFSKYQKKSAGSLIAGVTFSRQNVSIDFNSLPQEILQKLPGENREYNIHYNDYCVMLGYGYNWAFNRNWLFNATVFPCFGFNHSLSESEQGRFLKDKLAMNVKAKISLVYNHNNFYYSLNGKYSGHFYNANDFRFINSYMNLAVVAGFRF